MLAHGATPNRGQICVGITLASHRFPAVIIQEQEDKKRENRGAQGKQKQAPLKGACE